MVLQSAARSNLPLICRDSRPRCVAVTSGSRQLPPWRAEGDVRTFPSGQLLDCVADLVTRLSDADPCQPDKESP